MNKLKVGNLQAVNQNVREISFLLDIIGCKLKRVSKIKYEVISRGINTGLVIIFGNEVIDNKNISYIMAIMYFPIPDNDFRYFLDNGKSISEEYPYVKAHASNKRAKTLLFDFIFRSIYYYKLSNRFKKWYCYNCGEKGYEIFTNNGSLATFDSGCNEFKLIMVDNDAAIEGVVFDDLIGEHVLPICKNCEQKLGYTVTDDLNLTVDRMYFKKIVSKRFETASVMGVD